MFNLKKDNTSTKMKEFTLTNEELSEVSFIAQQQRVAQEILNYWDQRFSRIILGIKKRLGLGEDDQLNFSKLWTDGKLLSFHVNKSKVSPEETVPTEKNA